MSEAGLKTEAWRNAKKRQGYVLMAVWVPGETKAQYDLLCSRRGQALAACLTDAANVLTKQSGISKTFLMDERQLRRLVADMLGANTAAPAPEVEGDAPPPVDQLPEGKKQCRQGHLYEASRGECPVCTKLRKRRYRARQKQQRVG